MDPSALSLLYVRSSSGNLVPLSTVATLDRTVGPLTVNHFGQIPAVTVSFNLALGRSRGDAVAGVEKASREILSPTSRGARRARHRHSSRQCRVSAYDPLQYCIYIVGILYESYIHPITILSGLPSTGLGALITLLLFHIDLNLYALVGVIMLRHRQEECDHDDRLCT